MHKEIFLAAPAEIAEKRSGQSLEVTHSEFEYGQFEKEAWDYFAEQSPEIQNELAQQEAVSMEYLAGLADQAKKKEAFRRAATETVRKRFRTVRELYSSQYKPVEWLVPGILPNESLISIQGRPKCGKSTFVFAMLKTLVMGGMFLDKPVRPIKIVYLSEQNRVSFCQQLNESGIDVQTENMSVMTVEDFYPNDWKLNFDVAKRQVLETDAKLLVVDSWGKFAGFTQHEDEYQSGPTQERVSKLRELISATGATVLIIHHTGKQQGRNLIDAGLGATALAAQVDQAFSLSGEPQQQAALSTNMHTEQCRKLQSVGRFTDAIKDIEVERQPDGTFHNLSVEALGSTKAAPQPAQSVEDLIREAYARNPEWAEYGNQKLSRAIQSEMGIKLSERKIERSRQNYADLRRRK